MIKILLVCVNYNSYSDLDKYLKSIDLAAGLCDKTDVIVSVVDNSIKKETVELVNYKNINIHVNHFDNPGYFPGVANILNKEPSVANNNYVIISNVDLEISPDFFIRLSEYKAGNDVAWVANRIWSEQESRDINPKIIRRYTLNKLRLLKLLYKYPILDWIYTNSLYKRKQYQKDLSICEIYAGHGSFIILTRSFFNRYPKLDYPIFLFGEEIYLAEKIRKAGMKVMYVPEIQVNDKEHTSTGKMKKSFYYKCNLESIDYIIKKFYE